MEIINDQKRLEDLADNIVARTYEVYHYDTNIQNYEALLATYSVEWPSYLEQYRNMDPHQAAMSCDIEFIDELADCQQAERVSFLIKTEKMERAKAASILQILKDQMPDDIEEEYITAAIARRDAAMNQGV